MWRCWLLIWQWFPLNSKIQAWLHLWTSFLECLNRSCHPKWLGMFHRGHTNQCFSILIQGMLGLKPRTKLRCLLICQNWHWPSASPSISQSLPVTGSSWLVYPAPCTELSSSGSMLPFSNVSGSDIAVRSSWLLASAFTHWVIWPAPNPGFLDFRVEVSTLPILVTILLKWGQN